MDVELRKEMWKVVDSLRKIGVTIILTTHYIEEAEAIADRVAVINPVSYTHLTLPTILLV